METLNPQTAILLVGLVIVSIVFVPSFLVFAYVHLKSNQFSITDPASYGIVTALVVFAIGFPVVLIEPSFLAQLPSILLPIVGLCMLALMGYLMGSLVAKMVIPMVSASALSKKVGHVA